MIKILLHRRTVLLLVAILSFNIYSALFIVIGSLALEFFITYPREFRSKKYTADIKNN